MSRRPVPGPKLNVQRRPRASAMPTTSTTTTTTTQQQQQMGDDDNDEFSTIQRLTNNFQPTGIDAVFSQKENVTTHDNNNKSKFNMDSLRYGYVDDDSVDQNQTTTTTTTTATTTTTTGDMQQQDGVEGTEAMTSHFTNDFSRLYTDPATTLQNQVESKLLIQIQNIVAMVDLGADVDMKLVAMCAKNAEYNPRRFMSVVMRLREPKATALLFKSGKLVVAGTKSEYHAHYAARKFARLVQKIGHPNVTFNNFQVTNIVGTVDVRFSIDLDVFVKHHSQHASYDPELFPALIYRLHEPNVVAMIFVNGKVVISGARNRIELYTAFEILYRVICEYRKGGLNSLQHTMQSAGLPGAALVNSAGSGVVGTGTTPASQNGSLDPSFFNASFSGGLQTTSASLLQHGGLFGATTGLPADDDE